MIDNYRSDRWTDLLEGTLWKMTEKISENKQLYKAVDSDDVVNKVKHIFKDRFHSLAAVAVMELEVSQKYMVPETYGSTLNINLNQQWAPPRTQQEHQQRHMPIPPGPARVKTNILSSKERPVLVEGGRNTTILAGMQWLTSENGKICHFLIFSSCMCIIITRTKACSKYMDVIFSLALLEWALLFLLLLGL